MYISIFQLLGYYEWFKIEYVSLRIKIIYFVTDNLSLLQKKVYITAYNQITWNVKFVVLN